LVLLDDTTVQGPPGEGARSTFTGNVPVPLQENWKPEAGDMPVTVAFLRKICTGTAPKLFDQPVAPGRR
jgi:hypothetical protein